MNEPITTTGGKIGVGFALGGTIVAAAGLAPYFRVRNDNASAFATYDHSLRERLNLCADGVHIVDCRDSR